MSRHVGKLIINSPYEEPKKHWYYERTRMDFKKIAGRRSAGYIMATPNFKGHEDPGVFIPIELVNRIRSKVKEWRKLGYLGATSTTKRLLQHWQEPEERKDRRLFFCQLETIETLIWLTEAPAAEKEGIDIKGDGGDFVRWCSKMATGSGKTIVMSMIIAWQFLNKVVNPQDVRFSKYALVVAPGLTVKDRLQVLHPSHEENYYQAFNIVPTHWMEKLRQGRLVIHNWHALAWDTQEQIDTKIGKGQLISVDNRKRIEISDAAYVRQVLEGTKNANPIIVINDEAHHAWRVHTETASKYGRKPVDKESEKMATVWIRGLDRIHKHRGILRCFDLSATPFVPSGKKTEEALFNWIVSDFGLNDAIESGLVKTPRVTIRDDSYRTKAYKSRLYHIYADKQVKSDLNRKVDADEPLPDLVINAYNLLGIDWLEAKKEWEKAGKKSPPVMITVANRTETSARINYAFADCQISIPALCDPEKTLQIDTKVLASAEAEDVAISVESDKDSEEGSAKQSKKQQTELLRQKVNTVGKEGGLGEQIQHVISVEMLSEGWDTKTVTHIMGLRAFSSQLLCEQVVGRGLRRVSYEIGEEHGLFDPEYVNIFGVPFTFLPHEETAGVPAPPVPKTRIEAVQEKIAHAITWPNVVRIDRVYRSYLILNQTEIAHLEIAPYEAITKVELAEIIAGKPNPKLKKVIGLEKMAKGTRMQTIIFKVALRIYHSDSRLWCKFGEGAFLAQMVDIVSDFIDSEHLSISTIQDRDDVKWKVIVMLNMNKIVQHIRNQIKIANTEEVVAITERPNRSTENVSPWYTSKPCERTDKSHISHCVYDSRWEASEAYMLDTSGLVKSFVKNDHLGFAIAYSHEGIVHRYYPDFIVRLANNEHLLLEVKGRENSMDKSKRAHLEDWVKAVNNAKDFGKWCCDVSFHPNDLEGILSKYASISC